jgi:hypothetical protein
VPELSLSTSPGSTQAAIYQFDGTVSTNHLTVNAPGFELWLPTEANRIARMDLLAGLAEVHGGNGGSAMSVAGAVDGDFILVGHDDVVQHGALRVTGNFTLAADANATLTNAGNDFNSIGFTVGGSLDAYDANGFAAGGTADRAVRLGTGGVFTLAGDITSQDSATPSNIEITTAGFDNSANARLVVQDGGRFLIRSSDYTQDNLGGIGFSAADRANLNYTVLGGWTGADPTTGNGYYTNRTGTIDTPNGDRPGISREYDTTKGFAYLQSGHAAQGTLAGGGTASIGDYTVRSTGTFDDKNAGTGKGYDVAGTNDVSATATDGSAVYGLHYDAFRREAGPLLPGGLGNALSTVTPRTLTTSGITALDHGYDGTDHVGLDSSGATLNGVLSGDQVRLDASHASGATDTPVPGDHKPVTVSGLGLSGTDAGNYVLQSPALSANVTNGLRESFERLRDKQYLQALADDQEPFRREQLDALLAGFSKENIRRPLSRGLVYETGLAAPAVDDIGDPAMKPCTVDSVVCRHRKEAK